MTAEDAAILERIASARRSPHLAVLEGFHPLKHAIRFGARIDEVFLADRDGIRATAMRLAPDLSAWFERLDATVVPPATLALAGGGRSHGNVDVLAIAGRPAVDVAAVLAHPDGAPIVLLEEPTHLGNLGAVVRVAAAAGAAAVLVTGPNDPWHAAALRGSAGLHFAIPVAHLASTDHLQAGDRPLVAADPEGDAPLGALPARAILMLGSERRGLSDALRTHAQLRVRIPMRAGVSSLNLATAAAVLLYAGRR